jgi:hypothetical protein
LVLQTPAVSAKGKKGIADLPRLDDGQDESQRNEFIGGLSCQMS